MIFGGSISVPSSSRSLGPGLRTRYCEGLVSQRGVEVRRRSTELSLWCQRWSPAGKGLGCASKGGGGRCSVALWVPISLHARDRPGLGLEARPGICGPLERARVWEWLAKVFAGAILCLMGGLSSGQWPFPGAERRWGRQRTLSGAALGTCSKALVTQGAGPTGRISY